MTGGGAGHIDLGRHFERIISGHRMSRDRPDTEVERATQRIADAEEERRNDGTRADTPKD